WTDIRDPGRRTWARMNSRPLRSFDARSRRRTWGLTPHKTHQSGMFHKCDTEVKFLRSPAPTRAMAWTWRKGFGMERLTSSFKSSLFPNIPSCKDGCDVRSGSADEAQQFGLCRTGVRQSRIHQPMEDPESRFDG